MTEMQGRRTGALNIERIYSTTVPAEELARIQAAWPQADPSTTRLLWGRRHTRRTRNDPSRSRG
jgi:hypothetical protein